MASSIPPRPPVGSVIKVTLWRKGNYDEQDEPDRGDNTIDGPAFRVVASHDTDFVRDFEVRPGKRNIATDMLQAGWDEYEVITPETHPEDWAEYVALRLEGEL